jgi:squalene-hopene/tetraprenyl-beta-curcumene cyclase
MSPTAIAVGLAKFHNDPTHNPITRLVRRGLRKKTLAALEQLQAADDSFEGSPLATALVVMCVAGMGCQEHPIVERGIEFLLSSVRADASWAVTTNLSTIHTCMAVDGLFAYGGREVVAAEWQETATSDDTVANSDHRLSPDSPHEELDGLRGECVSWLLKTQHTSASKLTKAPAGGWGASDSPGAEPDTVATAAALVALVQASPADETNRSRIERAANRGINWLLEMQNDDGGWPTFTREDDSQPLAASGVDPTAQALRAIVAWQQRWKSDLLRDSTHAAVKGRIDPALARGILFLESRQRADGSFVPLWYGNEHQPDDENPVVGTAQVLAVCEALQQPQSSMATRAAAWLMVAQHSDGGWGPPRAPVDYSDTEREGTLRSWRENDTMAKFCSVEETSAAVAALLPLAGDNPATERSVSRGLQWLAAAVEQDAHRRPAVIGFYPGKIWYYDRLSPLAWAAGTLSRAVAAVATSRSATTPVG